MEANELNIKAVYADRVESWDTQADGSLLHSHAELCVFGTRLELWSGLQLVKKYDHSNPGHPDMHEEGEAIAIIDLYTPNVPKDLAGYLAAAHDELGLLRLDVDGETVYEYEEPIEEEPESEESKKVEFFVPNGVMPNG